MLQCQMPRTQRLIDAVRSLPRRSSESKARHCDCESVTETGRCQLAEPFCLINVSSVVDALLLNVHPLLHVLAHASVQPILCPLSTEKYSHHPKVESYFIWWECLGFHFTIIRCLDSFQCLLLYIMLCKYFSVSLIIFRVRSRNGITKPKDTNLFKTFSEYYHFYLQKHYIIYTSTSSVWNYLSSSSYFPCISK